jgi:2-oxoglutarate ferredoxin oxidoreductase subunit alpha
MSLDAPPVDSGATEVTPLPSNGRHAQNWTGETIINDIVITVATSNGTGSQSANLILMRTIFQMGVPVSGKNMFPSNIQGLPTWFTIRANKDGWTARRSRTDLLVAMNQESIVDDLKGLEAGAMLIVNEDLKQFINRDDLKVYLVPFSKLVVPVCPEAKLRRLVVNMLYVGVVAWLLQLDLDELSKALQRQFKGKAKAAEMNQNAVMAGYQWAAENLQRQDEFRIERMHGTDGKLIIEGNMAGALGLLYGGITVLAWYPITPSSSIAEYLMDYLNRYRRDPETGKATYAVVQAEDELASIAMVIGAGWAGARAATATSGPGISLMSEIAGLSYFAEIPAVIVDVQRMGPSTGLPTRTSQGDILKAYLLSHGDSKHVLLIPGTPEECYEFGMKALNLAEQLQTLVFLMLDLDLGMNNWMSDPFNPPTEPIERGKVLSAEDLETVETFARYRDVDGDGIPYRTLPGTHNAKAAYFTRGTGHTDRATYSEKPEDWKGNLDRLTRKLDTARKLAPGPIIKSEPGARVAIIAYGSSDPAIEEARYRMREERGWASDYLRIRALPFSAEVRKFIEEHDCVYVVEQNRDAQMASVFRMEMPDLAPGIRSILHYDGLPIDARSILNAIYEAEEKKD